jgi:dihydrolipoamide dehydrogenase
VLATGSRPVLPPVPGLAEALPWDSRDATSAKDVPPRLVVLGGGAVGVEMAQAFRRLGAVQVTVLEVADRLLAREEPFAGEEVRRGLEADGVDVRLESVRRAGPGAPVEVRLGTGDVVVGDELLVAAGRRVPTEELGVASVGVAAERFLPVDDQLRVRGAAGGWLYAVGDCNGLAPLTHMGKYHGRVVADVLLGRPVRDRVSRDVVPRVTFTDPQVCAVGPTEAEARQRGLPVQVVRCATGEVPGAYTQGVGVDGTSQLVVDAERRVVVGATFTGPGVQELLHSATVAVAGRVPLEDLWHAVPAFPTVSEVWLHLLERYGL